MSTTQTVYQKIREATLAVQKICSLKPQVGIVLGSGLGDVAAELKNPVQISYQDIPHFKATAVEGHAGKMLLGELAGVPTVILQGRFHHYEGYSMEQVVFPVRTLCSLGVHTVVLTNAAGGINTRFRGGDLMIINDHLNLMGDNPLRGPNLSEFGPRFPDLTEAYSTACVNALKAAADEAKVPVHEGVYAGLLGPTYETPAEVRMLRTLGADAVGMSTVPETIAAVHLGVRVAGVSCIANLAAGIHNQKLTHQEVIEVSQMGAKRLSVLLQKAMPGLAKV